MAEMNWTYIFKFFYMGNELSFVITNYRGGVHSHSNDGCSIKLSVYQISKLRMAFDLECIVFYPEVKS